MAKKVVVNRSATLKAVNAELAKERELVANLEEIQEEWLEKCERVDACLAQVQEAEGARLAVYNALVATQNALTRHRLVTQNAFEEYRKEKTLIEVSVETD